ncbi:MAG: hypothetical protein Q4C67_01080 [Deinococcus sp.]|nr:hypothetical protein [Deinococcus sp.]
MTNDNEKTVVYSVQGGDVTQERETRAQMDSEQAEYQPVAYADPGEVTEQFDHLATRNAEQMQTEMGSGDHAAQGTGGAGAGTFSPEAAALAGGNETTYHNVGGAVSRVEGGEYDLADPDARER